MNDSYTIYPSGKIEHVHMCLYGVLLVAGYRLVDIYGVTSQFQYTLEAFAVLAGVGALYFFYQFVARRCSPHTITSAQIIGRRGILRRRAITVPISRVANYEVLQSISGRILGVADLLIDTPGESGPELVMQGFASREIREFVTRLESAMRHGGGGHNARASSRGGESELSRGRDSHSSDH